MAKRFTDTEKYKKPFIKGLKGAYKLLWDYLYHDCDHAGIWIVDFEIAQIYIGSDMQVNKVDALKFFNDGEIRIIEIDNGQKWFIKPFVEFQYGELNKQNRVHASVIRSLKKYDLFKSGKGLVRPINGVKVKEKEKDKDKESPKNLDLPHGENFKVVWEELIKLPKWKNKKLASLKTALESVEGYDEEFAVLLVKSAIGGNWQGLTFPDTDNKYKQWQKSKNGHGSLKEGQIIDNDNYEPKQEW